MWNILLESYRACCGKWKKKLTAAFGSMAKHAYAFASTAMEQFGLSELAAKQYSGTMMAMLKSSDVAQTQAAKMSTTLAGLVGDIASFYNVETDEAFYKLRAAFSGETEPMKALGVNMNIVNLETFAGYNAMIERLQPETILFYGKAPKECKGSIVQIKAFHERFKKEVMGGRGASSSISNKGKPYGSEYVAVYQSGNKVCRSIQRGKYGANGNSDTNRLIYSTRIK